VCNDGGAQCSSSRLVGFQFASGEHFVGWGLEFDCNLVFLVCSVSAEVSLGGWQLLKCTEGAVAVLLCQFYPIERG